MVKLRAGIGSYGEVCKLFVCKQKTAYEVLRSLVVSEMCIRDRLSVAPVVAFSVVIVPVVLMIPLVVETIPPETVSYTHLTLPTNSSV